MAKYEEQAMIVADAITEFGNSPDALGNFVSYLTYHFDEWLQKYASTPEGMAEEFRHFANMDF